MKRKREYTSKFTKQALIVLALLAATWLCQCSIAIETPQDQNSTDFAFDFARESAGSATAKSTNVVVSPYGAYCLLSLVSNAASGITLAEMLRMLHAGANTISKLNADNNKDLKALASTDEKLKLAVANAIFVDKNFPILSSFASLANEWYLASIENLDFRKPESVKRINSWCDEKTHSCIPSILDAFSPADCMVLVNAVYYKGQWLHRFYKEWTTSEPFHLLSGKEKQVPLMQQEEMMRHGSSTGYSAVELPYYGSKQSLFILLPDKGGNASELLKTLNAKGWAQLQKGMTEKNVRLSLPRFRVNFELNLNSVLNHLGMVSAFNPRAANFQSLAKEQVFVSKAIQKTFMDVNELGTEAAAVTAISALTSYHRQPEPIAFRVDRPFVVALRDKGTGQFLFIGIINDP